MVEVGKVPSLCGPPGKGVLMVPIVYKGEQKGYSVLNKLMAAGYSSYRIRKEGLINQTALQRLRENKLISWEQLASICALLNCQPGDLIEYVPDEKK